MKISNDYLEACLNCVLSELNRVGYVIINEDDECITLEKESDNNKFNIRKVPPYRIKINNTVLEPNILENLYILNETYRKLEKNRRYVYM